MARAATARLKVNDPLGIRPSLENRRIGELKIDPAYQRSIDNGPSLSLIRRIAMFWDWSLFQPLVIARRDDGSFWVVDGQHRLAAARARGDMYDLPCVVTSYPSAGDEAAAFVALNQQRRPLGPLDLFRAAVAANDEESLVITKLLRSAGLALAPHLMSVALKPGLVSNIKGIQNCYRRYGEKPTAAALRVLATAFAGQPLRYGGTIFSGLQHVIGKGIDALDLGLLTEILAAASQPVWMDDIKLEKAVGNAKWEFAAEAVIARAYGEAAAEMEDAA